MISGRLKYCVIFAFAALMLLKSGCSKEEKPVEAEPEPPNNYVGSKFCISCHSATHTHPESHQKHGHAHALKKITNGQPPSYAFHYDRRNPILMPGAYTDNIKDLPYGMTWNDVAYVIGGYKWNALFIDKQGKIVTGANANYLYFEDYTYYEQEFGPYPLDNTAGQGQADFTCGPCHTTGYSAEGNQDGLPGIIGTWEEEGVQCEACHGPGEKHAASNLKADIVKDVNVCRNCHVNGDPTRIEVSYDGMIMSHQQWEEMEQGPHAPLRNPQFALGCITCHTDPHATAAYKDSTNLPGPLICLSCHADRWLDANWMAGYFDNCVICHMGHVDQSGLPAPLIDSMSLHADIRTHVVSILADSNLLAPGNMYDTIPGQQSHMKTNDSGYVFLTLDRSCTSCHILNQHRLFPGILGRFVTVAETAMVDSVPW
jgi:hypothetical protein